MEGAGTRGFTPKELAAVFTGVDEVRVEKVTTPYDRRVAGPLARATGSRMGWFSVIRGTVAA